MRRTSEGSDKTIKFRFLRKVKISSPKKMLSIQPQLNSSSTPFQKASHSIFPEGSSLKLKSHEFLKDLDCSLKITSLSQPHWLPLSVFLGKKTVLNLLKSNTSRMIKARSLSKKSKEFSQMKRVTGNAKLVSSPIPMNWAILRKASWISSFKHLTTRSTETKTSWKINFHTKITWHWQLSH